MKYMVHLKPPEDISMRIREYQQQYSDAIIKIPSSEPHCTIMTLYVSPEYENRMIKTLDDISVPHFYMNTENLKVFDPDMLVIRLKRHMGILAFHNNIINALKEYINPNEIDRFEGEEERRGIYEMFGSKYYSIFYEPHMTIAKVNGSSEDFENPFRDISWEVNGFYLSKKNEGWNTIRKFEQ